MLDVLLKIWYGHSGYVFLPQRRDGIWHEGEAVHLDRSNWPLFNERSDLYFTPLVFDVPDRKNENVSSMNCLYADIDTGSAPIDIRPTICWETSPDSYQGVWMLDQFISPQQFGALNRDLTYFIQADRGGWHASKVLRVPCTLNWKRAQYTDSGLTVPRGKLLWADGDYYNPVTLRDRIPRVGGLITPVPRLGVEPSELGERDRQSILASYRDVLPLRVRSWLGLSSATDRSMMIWKVACSMAMAEIPPEDAFQMMCGTAWNKWKDDPKKLWRDINKAYAAVHSVSESAPTEREDWPK